MLIVMFDVTNPESLAHAAENWFPEVARYCPGVPVLLVGNKADLRDDPYVIDQIGEDNFVTEKEARNCVREYGACVGYWEISAFTQEGLKNLFDHCARYGYLHVLVRLC